MLRVLARGGALTRRPALRHAVPAAALLSGALLACAPPPAPPDTAAEAPVAQSSTPRPAPRRAAAPPDTSGLALYYRQVEAQRRASGLMRTDAGGPDTPFNARILARNFEQIALHDEYVLEAGRPVARATPARLRRWEAPVRMHLYFGASMPAHLRVADRSFVADYVARLADLTRHPLSLVDDSARANFHVLVLDEAERRAIGPRLRMLLPGIDDDTVRIVTGIPRETFCLVLAFSRGGSSVYTDALAIVRAELPDLTRQGCYHEELAQGLGLPNDSPQARPSIFNDAKEFVFLTRHDELLLRLLYDPRLSPGMWAAEARPIVRRGATELLAEPSRVGS